LIARNHMILEYKMAFSSIPADSTQKLIWDFALLVGRVVGRRATKR
jgi:hypothetical protein